MEKGQQYIRAILLWFGFCFGVPFAVSADLQVKNWSFEEDKINGQALGSGQWVNGATDWQESIPGGNDNFTENVGGFRYMGDNHQGMTSGSALWQDIFHPPGGPQAGQRQQLEPGVKYSLIVAIGNRPGGTQSGNRSIFRLQVVNGGTVQNGTIVGGTVTTLHTLQAGEVDASTIPAGTFKNFNVTYDAGASVPPGSLRVFLQCGSSDRAHFDNVHLVAVKPRDLSGGYANPHPQTPSSPQDPVPAWESRPGLPHVIYLDFDGEPQIGPMPEWNMGRPLINLPAAGLNVTEMRRAYEIVKEDYLPFNVNITTDRSKYDAAVPGRRMRCIITTADRWLYEEDSRTEVNFGGIAHTGSFPLAGRTRDPAVPCFVFISDWSSAGSQIQSGANAAQDISHEVGHTLGLQHDGIPAYPPDYLQANDYFGGFGTTYPTGGYGVMPWSPRRWGPIMGHGQFISQWNDGTYAGATNGQDDVAVIASLANGFGYAPDDNLAGEAANAVPISTVNDSFTKEGFIGRTASGAEDEDWWKIVLQADAVLDLKLNPYEPFTSGDANTRMELNLGIPNLVARVDLYRQNGSAITGASPTLNFSLPPNATPAQRLRLMDALRVQLIQNLSAGTYYLRITGAGFGNPQTDGATSYGSMGGYLLDGMLRHHPVIANADRFHVVETGTFFSKLLFVQGGPATWSASGLPPGLRIASDTGSVTGVPLVPGTYTTQFVASGPGGQGSANVTFYVGASAALANAVDLAIPLTWQFDNVAGWFTQTGMSSDGVDAAQASAVSAGQSAHMETTFTGPGYLTFRWKFSAHPTLAFVACSKNGTEMKRLTADDGWHIETIPLSTGTNTIRWTFGKQPGAVPAGADTAWVDTALLEPEGSDLPSAVDMESLTIDREGDAYWHYDVTGQAGTGADTARSGTLTHGQSCGIATTIIGPGTLRFKWAANCEPTHDYLAWFLDGAELGRRSSTNTGVLVPFTTENITVPAGTHRIVWRYVKDVSVSDGADAVWINEFQWTPALPPPVITNPLSVTWTVGALISYPITATNSPSSYNLTGTLPTGLFYSGPDHLILGYPQRAGTWGVSLSATNGGGTGTQNFFMTIEPAYAKWVRDRGLAGPDALMSADPDRDGRSNLLEMGMNLNPILRETNFAPVTFNSTTKRMTATFTRVPAYLDLRYEVQVSDNPASWTTIASSTNGGVMTSNSAFSVTDPGGSAPVTVTVVDNSVWPTKTKRYMRIKITQL